MRPSPNSVAAIIATSGERTTADSSAERTLQSLSTQSQVPDEIVRIHAETIERARRAGESTARSQYIIFIPAGAELNPQDLAQRVRRHIIRNPRARRLPDFSTAGPAPRLLKPVPPPPPLVIPSFDARGRRVIAYVGNFEPRHSTENHVALTLENDLGYSVLRLQENRVSTDVIRESCLRYGVSLLLYTRTWGFQGDGNKLLRDLHMRGVPSASYHLDLYWGISRERSILGDPFWNTKYVFTADGGSDDNFKLVGINHKWIRAGVYRPECYLAKPDPRFVADVAFVGGLDSYHPEWLPYRQKLKWHLNYWYGERFRYWPKGSEPAVRNEDLNALYATARVVIGDSLCKGFNHPRYWSDRLYETIGRGGFVLFPRIAGIEDEFVDGKTIALFDFNDWAGLKERIDYYLTHEAERLRIRNAGHEWVKRNATYTNRLREILDYIALAEAWPESDILSAAA